MEVSDLRTFIAVMETGGISLAAKSLHRVPSGVTARIMQMEEDLGIKLFLREKKRLLPTARGQTLYAYARRITALMDEAELCVKGMEPGGRFRIGALESAAAARLPEILAHLHAEYPAIELELAIGTSCSLYEDILENRLDAVFIVDAPADERLERVEAFNERLVLIATSGHAPIHTPDDIGRKAVLAFQGGCAYRKRLVNWFRAYGWEPQHIVELASYHAIVGGVIAGMGVGVVPASVLELCRTNGMLSVHALEHPLCSAVTELVWRRGMASANVAAICRCLSICGQKTAAAEAV
ncbi:MAG: LysR family transcriptional regulator [Pygmaiobacter sp.]|nr:LysR family transcriptional regulator [Pygmaiobacter sp.]